MELIAKVPHMDSAQFDKIMNSTMQVSRLGWICEYNYTIVSDNN